MDRIWKMKAAGRILVLACAAAAAEQALPPPRPENNAPLLTLDSPMLRQTMDRMNLPRGILDKVPDFRLKLDRSEELLRTPLEWEDRLRGVEIRLPMSAFWLGYGRTAEGEEPQATFSIQLGF